MTTKEQKKPQKKRVPYEIRLPFGGGWLQPVRDAAERLRLAARKLARKPGPARSNFAWIKTRLATDPLEVVEPRVSPKANASLKAISSTRRWTPSRASEPRCGGGQSRVAHPSPRQGTARAISGASLGRLRDGVLDRIDTYLGICQNPADLLASSR